MLTLEPRTFEAFAAEAERGSVVPVVRTVLADLQTPVSALLRVAGDAPHSFLLESVEGGERLARYSFLGSKPHMVVRGRGRQTTISYCDGHSETHDVTAIEFLRNYFGARRLAQRRGLPPLAGGAVGYLAYDAARWFEPVLDAGAAEGDDAVLLFCKDVLTFDRVRQQILISSLVFVDEAGGDTRKLHRLYDAAVAETERLERTLDVNAAAVRPASPAGPDGAQFAPEWERGGFEDGVRRIKELIAAGECYQVVLSQRFSRDTEAAPIDIYRALRSMNPSPYMFFLRLGEETLIGASPEMLVRCRGRELEYRPIAGTRQRGRDEEHDRELAEEMRADEKERAEHLMLVDLGRNDLGRVAEYGTVQVAELMEVERYSHVQHLVSGLRARLRPDLDRFDALGSCFPAGTVSGAPKIRAMQVIRELEPTRRGVYAGSVLYLDYGDNLDSCIAIRTLVLRDGKAYAQAGAGIVADSVPEREYEESVNKASALLRAVEMAERGL